MIGRARKRFAITASVRNGKKFERLPFRFRTSETRQIIADRLCVPCRLPREKIKRFPPRPCNFFCPKIYRQSARTRKALFKHVHGYLRLGEKSVRRWRRNPEDLRPAGWRARSGRPAAGYWRRRRRPARGMDRRQSSTCWYGRGVRVCTVNVCVCAGCETRRAPAGRRRSSFRMVQHEYVLDETVGRRLVRRYHLKGAAAAIMLGVRAHTHRKYEWLSAVRIFPPPVRRVRESGRRGPALARSPVKKKKKIIAKKFLHSTATFCSNQNRVLRARVYACVYVCVNVCD